MSILHRRLSCKQTHSRGYEVPILPSEDRTLPQRAKRSDLPHPWAALPIPFQMLPGLLWGETQPIRLRGSSAGHEERNFLQELCRGQCVRASRTWETWKVAKEILAFQFEIIFVPTDAGSAFTHSFYLFFQWDDMRVLASAFLPGHRSMNPCPVYDEFTGTLFLFFIAVLGHTSESYQLVTGKNVTRLCYTCSTDDGATWSPVTDLTKKVIGDTIKGPVGSIFSFKKTEGFLVSLMFFLAIRVSCL